MKWFPKSKTKLIIKSHFSIEIAKVIQKSKFQKDMKQVKVVNNKKKQQDSNRTAQKTI